LEEAEEEGGVASEALTSCASSSESSLSDDSPRNERLGSTESCQPLRPGCHVDNELKNDRSGLWGDQGGIKIGDRKKLHQTL
jgi:hypothetical protein